MPASSHTNDAFDRYEVLSPLGVGGFATVYLARHRPSGTEVALKIGSLGGDAELRMRALNEARVLSALTHPSLARVHECGALADGRVFIAMERIVGPSLESVLDRNAGRIDARRAIRLGLDALSALELVHAHGIVHRDLKPANLLVRHSETNREQLVVVDFGISKVGAAFGAAVGAERPETVLGAALGTPGYMAPEQLDARTVDARADLYGLAAVLYRAITGRTPYETRSVEDFARAVAAAPAPPLVGLSPFTSPAIAHVIDRALARDRDARPKSARAMRDALEAALALDVALTGTTATQTIEVDLRGTRSSRSDGVETAAHVSGSSQRGALPTPTPRRNTGPIGLVAVGFLSMGLCAAIAWSIIRMFVPNEAPLVARTTLPARQANIATTPSPVARTPTSTNVVSTASIRPSRVAPSSVDPESGASETNARSEGPAAPTNDATDASPPARAGRRVRFVGAQPVGSIDMDEIHGFVRRALSRIDACHQGAGPARTELLMLFNTMNGPTLSGLSDSSDVGRCTSSALLAVIGREGTRSSGVLRNITFVWD